MRSSETCPKPVFKGTKNGWNRQEYDLSFWSKEKGLQRLHPNPSVHSFYNRLLLESGIIHTSIVSIVYLVYWAILYRFQWLLFSFDPSPYWYAISSKKTLVQWSFLPLFRLLIGWNIRSLLPNMTVFKEFYRQLRRFLREIVVLYSKTLYFCR